MTDTLPERFLAPKGWRTGFFVNNETGHRISYGSVFPQRAQPPTAIIVCLGGLSEFAEKYFEVAHDMLDRGYAFWFIEWQYQGRSGRMEPFPQRRHSDGFDTDVSDLHKFIADYVKPSAVHPDCGRIPLVMLAHSMGGNIGLNFLIQHPKFFDAAALSAPFLGIYDFKWPMRLLAAAIAPLLPFVGKKYVFQGTDWSETARTGDDNIIFSSDAVRNTVHRYWSLKDPQLRIGSVTFSWVIQALKSCASLTKPGALNAIKIPILIAVAGDDKIVDNQVLRAVASRLPQGRILEIDGSRHEILMEIDEYRDVFLKAFDKMMEEHKIATIENLKKF